MEERGDIQRDVGWRGSGGVENGDRMCTRPFKFCDRNRSGMAAGKDSKSDNIFKESVIDTKASFICFYYTLTLHNEFSFEYSVLRL